jgi:cytochrome c oxidase subunit 1
MPRRYAQFTEYKFLETLHPLVVFVTIAVFVTAAIQVVFLFNFIWSLFKGPKAGDNPWEATTLEWATTSPPPHDNFAGIVPTVYRGAYEFSVPGAPNDFIMQTEPDPSQETAAPSVLERQGGNGNGHQNGH